MCDVAAEQVQKLYHKDFPPPLTPQLYDNF